MTSTKTVKAVDRSASTAELRDRHGELSHLLVTNGDESVVPELEDLERVLAERQAVATAADLRAEAARAHGAKLEADGRTAVALRDFEVTSSQFDDLAGRIPAVAEQVRDAVGRVVDARDALKTLGDEIGEVVARLSPGARLSDPSAHLLDWLIAKVDPHRYGPSDAHWLRESPEELVEAAFADMIRVGAVGVLGGPRPAVTPVDDGLEAEIEALRPDYGPMAAAEARLRRELSPAALERRVAEEDGNRWRAAREQELLEAADRRQREDPKQIIARRHSEQLDREIEERRRADSRLIRDRAGNVIGTVDQEGGR